MSAREYVVIKSGVTAEQALANLAAALERGRRGRVTMQEEKEPRRDGGGQTMEYARDLAQRAQSLAERAYQKLAPISVVSEQVRDRVAEEPPAPPYFRELYEYLATVTTALDSIEDALDAVDV